MANDARGQPEIAREASYSYPSNGAEAMIKIKHFMDAKEADDGERLWVESIKLTKDLTEWCHVDPVLPHLGPPMELCEWFEEHPDGYEYFRGNYHEHLTKGGLRKA